MKDTEIFNMLEQSTGLSKDDVVDYRPCNKLYTECTDIPNIEDAIAIKLKENGTLIYIPDKDMNGNQIQRETQDMKAKIVMCDGIFKGALISSAAKKTGLQLDIVDATSDYDTENMVRQELEEPKMWSVNVTVRHAKAIDE